MIYTHWLDVIATDYQIGNELAAVIDPNSGGARTFDTAASLYPAGTTFAEQEPVPPLFLPQPPVPSAPEAARYACVPVREQVAAIVEEFNGDGPYPALNARGVPDWKIAAAKATLVVRCGDRSANESTWRAFIEAHGYVMP